METPNKIRDELYSASDLAKVIKKYEELFMILNIKLWYLIKTDLWVSWDDQIVDIKRWLADWSKKVFWDYLSTPHRLMEERIGNWFNKNEMCRCIKLVFASWKTIIFSKDSTLNKQPKWVISLDEYFIRLDSKTKDYFGKISLQLSKIEEEHFKSEAYKSTITNFLDSTEGELFLALNLKAE